MKSTSSNRGFQKAFILVIAAVFCCMSWTAMAQIQYQREAIHVFDSYAGPYGIAIDQDGNYIVGEAGTRNTTRTSRVSRITPSGMYVPIYTETVSPNYSQLYDLAIDSNGDYIIVESWRGTIAKVSPTGTGRTLIYQFPSPAYPGFPYPLSPLGIELDRDGSYLVLSSDTWGNAHDLYRVDQWGTASTFIYRASIRGPYDVAVDSDGNYIVTESGSGSNFGALARVTPGGDRTELYRFTYDAMPLGVAIDSDGSYLVVEHHGERLSRISWDGTKWGKMLVYQFAPASAPARVAIDQDGTYIVTEVGANALSRIFPNLLAITAGTAGMGGAISPTGVLTVPRGASQSFTIMADPGYDVADVLVDGVSAGAVTTYTFNNITANHTITASFAIKTYTITASAGLNGAISPSGSVTVIYDESKTFNMAPLTGGHTVDVLVDGASVGVVASYTFTHVIANHTIEVSFAANTQSVNDQLRAIVNGGCISKKGIIHSLLSKIDNAEAAEKRGDLKARAGIMGAFINEVEAQTGKAIEPKCAADLIALAKKLL